MASFEVITRAAQPTAVIHERVPMAELPGFFQRAFGEVARAITVHGLAPAGPPFALYHGMPGDTVEVEAGFPVARPLPESGAVHTGVLPGGRCAHGTHVGPYDTLQLTYGALAKWVSARGLTPHEEMWEEYLSDPRREPNPTTWRTEIYLPLD